MKVNWQQAHRHPDMLGRGRWVALYVTLNRKGEITLSRTTWQKLGEPPHVMLLFDSVNNRIGVKPVAADIRDSFPVVKRGSHGGRRIAAYSMLQEFRIVVPDTIQFFDAEINHEGILILDLRTARVPNMVLNHSTRRAKGTQ